MKPASILPFLSLCFFLLFGNPSVQAQSWQWAKNVGGINWDYSSSICVDNSGSVFITGQYFFPYAIFGSDTLSMNGLYELFITKLSQDGNFLWSKRAGGTNSKGGSEDMWDMFCDSSENKIILAGTMEGSDRQIGGCSSEGSSDAIFLTKLDTEGKCIWSVDQASMGRSYMISICRDNTGHIYMVGNTEYTSYFSGKKSIKPGGFLAKFNNNDGSLCWVKNLLARNASFSDIDVTNEGIMISGVSAVDVLTIDSTTIACHKEDIFISQFEKLF